MTEQRVFIYGIPGKTISGWRDVVPLTEDNTVVGAVRVDVTDDEIFEALEVEPEVARVYIYVAPEDLKKAERALTRAGIGWSEHSKRESHD